ncbi:MAG: dienelactone hydrolase, partial [Bacteroidia bacterium]
MVELFKEEVRVLGAEDHLISCDLRFNPDLRSMPVVLFCHGFKGFKDWGPWNLVADRFAEAGIFFIKMNFSHNGVHPDNLLDITDPESFGQNSISKELADIKAVVDWFVNDNEIYKPYVDEENISIIGHSRGAATSIISILENDKLRNVICWSGAYNLEKFLNLIPDEKWKLDGKTEVINGRTGQSYP